MQDTATKTPTGWRTLAEPTYGIDARTGEPDRLPVGTQIDILTRPTEDGTVEVAAFRPSDEDPTYWFVEPSALRFEDACGQCGHARDAHHLYTKDGDDEPWSFCSDCGGDCEFVAQTPKPSLASLGKRLGFQPIQGRTHGYNGQEHR